MLIEPATYIHVIPSGVQIYCSVGIACLAFRISLMRRQPTKVSIHESHCLKRPEERIRGYLPSVLSDRKKKKEILAIHPRSSVSELLAFQKYLSIYPYTHDRPAFPHTYIGVQWNTIFKTLSHIRRDHPNSTAPPDLTPTPPQAPHSTRTAPPHCNTAS